MSGLSKANATIAGAGIVLFGSIAIKSAGAQAPSPTMLDPHLAVRTVVSGLNQPTTLAFVGPDDMLVLEKASGKVQRVTRGVLQPTPALDLAVNSAVERGLLGIALHPDFPRKPWVYLYWTESSTGADSTNVADVPLLGNRVDRFVWNGSTLTWDKNLIRLHAFQADAGQPLRGNHNGGILRFALKKGDDGDRARGGGDPGDQDDQGDDGVRAQDAGRGGGGRDTGDGRDDRAKLYVIIGDNGRRGLLQNITTGGLGPNGMDDQFGGPAPDNAHLTGVVLRLNDDGSTPTDNPFYGVGSMVGGEVGANLQKIFAYGVRNSFGMAFDPKSGDLWDEQNGDDSFDEINRVEPGRNGGWIQIMGPVDRIAQFKEIETTLFGGNLQQIRFPPTLLADTPAQALSRLFVLPGSRYSDPEFSWKFAVAPAGIGFVRGRGLGKEYEGDLFVGAARTFLAGGYLFDFKLTPNRKHVAVSDPRLLDGVADNTGKFDITESESLLIGRNFGVGTDIETGPDGNVYVVSLSNGAVYQISRAAH